jgi:hypothetical protein
VDKNDCYNVPKNKYRVLRIPRATPWIKETHFVWEPTFRNIEKGTIDNATHTFSVYPYRFYWLRLLYWNMKKKESTAPIIAPIIKKTLLWIVIPVIVGLMILYIGHILGWNK